MIKRRVRKDAKIKAARRLRKQLTLPELYLWLRLRDRGPGKPVFRNQHPYGPYVLDFYCSEARLCVEVDGGLHTYDKQQRYDEARDRLLSDEGIYSLRVPASELFAAPDTTADAVINLAIERTSVLKNV